MKRYIFLLLLFSIISSVLYAQNVKYGELIEMVKQGKYQKSYPLLYEFQAKNPNFPNTYFHLGNISFKFTKKTDPRINGEITYYYVYNAKLFYNLGLSKLAEQSNEVRKHDDYYKTVPEFKDIKKLENPIVVDYINRQLKAVIEYENKSKEIVNYFHSLIRSYSKTKEFFNKFITENDNINTILIEPKNTTLETTNRIINLYDSTLYYYQLYKNALINYPLVGVSQTLVEKKIKTYRLQGLTGTNFLADTIFIWNYKKWAQDIQKELNSNINHFRKTIDDSNKKMVSKEKELLGNKKASNKPFLLDQVVSFEVEKYDYNSIISTLFNYRKEKIDFLLQSRKEFNDTADYSCKLELRATEYHKLSLIKMDLDSLLSVFYDKLNKKNYKKHEMFFEKNYGNLEMVREFVSKQKNDNSERYKSDLEAFNYFIYRDIYSQSKDSQFVKYKGKEINLSAELVKPSDASNNKYYTLASTNFDKTKYITGYYKSAAGAKAFIAKIEDHEVKWLKMKGSTFGVKVAAQESGCVWILHSQKGGVHKNQIIQMSTDGKEVFKQVMSNTSMPRFLHYDDINLDVLMAFQGNELNYFAEQYESPLEIKKINTASKEVSIDRSIILRGNLVNILKINSVYYLFANYNKMGYDTKTISSDYESIGLLKFTDVGEFVDMVKIKTMRNIWATCALKIDDKTISITALDKKTDIYNCKFKNLPSMYNLIATPEGKILYENFGGK